MLLIHSSQSKISGARRGSRVCTASRLMILPPFPRARAALRCGGRHAFGPLQHFSSFFSPFSANVKRRSAERHPSVLSPLCTAALPPLTELKLEHLAKCSGPVKRRSSRKGNLTSLVNDAGINFSLPYHKWRSDQSNLK